MRRALLLLALAAPACAPRPEEGTMLVVPATDLVEHHVDDVELTLAVPREDLAAQPQGPRPRAVLVVPAD